MFGKNVGVSALYICGVLTVGAAQSASAATAAAIVSQNDTENETDMPLLAHKDMTLDLAEVKTAASARFDKLNQDGDSTLEAAEVEGVIGTKLFKLADPDHDGTISKDEYLALVEKLFKKADRDNDGSLSVDELKSKSALQLKKLID